MAWLEELPFDDRETELVIAPGMAFGTGHHATTRLMLRMLEAAEFCDRAVIDAGTGTGVPAIYAALRGARPVTAFDVDPVAACNARENARRNGSDDVEIFTADMEFMSGRKADCVLANLHRELLIAHAVTLLEALRPGGRLLVSGLLVRDGEAVREALEQAGTRLVETRTEESWIAQLHTS